MKFQRKRSIFGWIRGPFRRCRVKHSTQFSHGVILPNFATDWPWAKLGSISCRDRKNSSNLSSSTCSGSASESCLTSLDCEVVGRIAAIAEKDGHGLFFSRKALEENPIDWFSIVCGTFLSSSRNSHPTRGCCHVCLASTCHPVQLSRKCVTPKSRHSCQASCGSDSSKNGDKPYVDKIERRARKVQMRKKGERHGKQAREGGVTRGWGGKFTFAR